MEQVLAPEFKFTPRPSGDDEPSKPGTIKIRGLNPIDTSTLEGQKVDKIIKSDLQDLTAKILQDDKVQQVSAKDGDDTDYLQAIESTIIQRQYPDLNNGQIETVRQYVHANIIMKTNPPIQKGNDLLGDTQFLTLGNKFVNVNDLDINLIDSINPFSHAFEVISKRVDKDIFQQIRLALESTRVEMTEEEALVLYPEFVAFREANGRNPSLNAKDKREVLLAKFQAFMIKNRSKYISEAKR